MLYGGRRWRKITKNSWCGVPSSYSVVLQEDLEEWLNTNTKAPYTTQVFVSGSGAIVFLAISFDSTDDELLFLLSPFFD